MLAAIGGTATHGDMYIDGAEAAAVSLPEFPGLFGAVGGLIDEA
jgi:hypothetical protein